MSFCPYCDKNVEGTPEIEDLCLDIPPAETHKIECPHCEKEIEVNWEWERVINVEEPSE